MELQVDIDGTETDPVPFDCAATFGSRWAARGILEGRTYPHLPFVDDVQVVLDIGANAGAATRYLAHHRPDAKIYAFEPAAGPRQFLERNVAHLPNVTVHPVGLGREDVEVPLYHGLYDDISGSTIFRPDANRDDTEVIRLRRTAAWLDEQGLDRLDIVKLDIEGTEIEVLEELVPWLPTIKVLYVEYDSRQARKALGRLLDATHDLYLGVYLTLDQGECTYVRQDVANHPYARPFLLRSFLQHAGGAGPEAEVSD